MRKEGGHQVAVDRGESFLKEYGPFSGNTKNWRFERQRLIKFSPSRQAPQTAPEHSPAFLRVRRQKGKAAGRENSTDTDASKPCLSPV